MHLKVPSTIISEANGRPSMASPIVGRTPISAGTPISARTSFSPAGRSPSPARA
ncbi:hypothetical protein ACFVSS_05205 [Peribacillus butanolivorans]|uniref:hypothetical protein n=1 Tax=Peribacillus butanolivorans TaxID=421767 RepID=UPI0036DAE638